MTLPDYTDEGRLPFADKPYVTTLDEVLERFVVNAAHAKKQRERLFAALDLHLDLVRRRFGTGTRAWINGGFVTDKDWPPKDVDIVYVMSNDRFIEAVQPENAPLWTLLGVSAGQPSLNAIERVQPMGGLVDAFPVPDAEASTGIWFDRWSSVKNKAGGIVVDERKGFVEVTL